MGIYSVYGLLQPRFRRARWRFFIEQFRPTESTRILDVGGVPGEWLESGVPSRIVILNLPGANPGWQLPDRCTYQAGDGRQLPFPDQSFDIVFSNSAIEHLKTQEDQRRFANEALRVGKQVFVQTPNRWF